MDRFVFSLAEPGDSEEILEIMEEGQYPGNVSLLFTRRDNAYRSLKREGEEVDIFLCRDRQKNKIAAFGVCALRTLYMNGQPIKTGYFFSLKARSEYRRNFRFLHKGYAFSRQIAEERKIPFFLMTVVEDNRYAVKLFEKRRSFMPDHHPLGAYEIYAMKTGMKCRAIPGFDFKKCEREDMPAVFKFLNENGKNYQFFPALNAADFIDGNKKNISFEHFYMLCDRENMIAACGAVWDQKKYKQYIVKEYNGILKVLRPFSFLLPVFGYPDILPKPGAVLDFFTLSHWMIRDNNPEIFSYFLRSVSRAANRYPFFTIGMHERNALKPVVTKIPHIRYRGNLYLVDWDKTKDRRKELDADKTIYLECGAL